MSEPTGFRFADFEADVLSGELRRGGSRVRLQDLPFRLLVALAARPGELLTREELRKTLWPTESHGDFGHRLGGALNRLREALGDPADHPRIIETVPRRGYRFCAMVVPLGAEAVVEEPIEPESTIGSEPPPPAPARRGPRLALAAVAVLAVSAGAWHVVPSVAGDEPAGVAVMPFVDLSGADRALCDGLTEDSITALSRQALPVIGRTSAMAYRSSGKRVDEIGRELGVSHVVEGSVRRGARQVRVTVRLLAARRQTPVWSESFEGEWSDPLALQSLVAREVAQAVHARLSAR